MIYLARTTADLNDIRELGGVEDVQPLDDDLVMVDAELTRSRLYHRLKALRASDGALLVATLSTIPKFKGMEPGALAWARDRLRPG